MSGEIIHAWARERDLAEAIFNAALAAERLDWHGSLADGSDPIGKWYEVIGGPHTGHTVYVQISNEPGLSFWSCLCRKARGHIL